MVLDFEDMFEFPNLDSSSRDHVNYLVFCLSLPAAEKYCDMVSYISAPFYLSCSFLNCLWLLLCVLYYIILTSCNIHPVCKLFS